MRELKLNECAVINGGLSMVDSISYGGGAGSALGIIVSNTAAGAGRGGAIGAALGFSFGVGYAIGGSIYRRYPFMLH